MQCIHVFRLEIMETEHIRILLREVFYRVHKILKVISNPKKNKGKNNGLPTSTTNIIKSMP